MVSALLEQQLHQNGADLESKDGSGRTPLSLAAEKGHEVVKLLFKTGADLESKDNCGWTPLWWAAATGRDGGEATAREGRRP
ncbi:hypothetical protein V8E54_002928 [Elaphomyces granulatus]